MKIICFRCCPSCLYYVGLGYFTVHSLELFIFLFLGQGTEPMMVIAMTQFRVVFLSILRSRDRTHDGDRHDRDREHAGPSTRGHDYVVIQTQPRSSRSKRAAPRRHTVGGSQLTTVKHVEVEQVSEIENDSNTVLSYCERVTIC